MAIPDHLECIRCSRRYPLDGKIHQCTSCALQNVHSNLTVRYACSETLDRQNLPQGLRSLWRYEHALPSLSGNPVSMGEGTTPLIQIEGFGHGPVYAKDESRNPTCSFKDRLATVAVSWIRDSGKQVIAVSSTGNAGAAIAAYAARTGLRCVVLTGRATPGALLAQMQSYGAMVVTLPTIGDRWSVLSTAVEELDWQPTAPFFAPTVGSHPVGIEGYKTIAYEIAEQYDWQCPDWCVLPVCYGDALFGMWKGFEEMRQWGWTDTCPRLVAAEVSGSLTAAIERRLEMPPDIPRNDNSAANSINVTRSTYQACHALSRSKGLAVTLDDSALVDARDRLATSCGLSAELSSAAGFAAVDKLCDAGVIDARENVAVVMTASGLKDYGSSESTDIPDAKPALDSVLRVLEVRYGWHM